MSGPQIRTRKSDDPNATKLQPLWRGFYTDGVKQGGHDRAWCLAEMRPWIAQSKMNQASQRLLNIEMGPDKTEKEWYRAASQHHTYISGKTTNLRTHLLNCNVINNNPHEAAARDAIIEKADEFSAKRAPMAAANSQPTMNPGHGLFINSSAGPSYSPSMPFSPSPAPIPSPLSQTFGAMPFHDSPSPQMYQSPSPFAGPPPKRRKTSTDSTYSSIQPSPPSQEQFERDLCSLFTVCGFSWNAAANPEFRSFFDKYLPAYALPDRRKLSGPILDELADDVVERARKETTGKLATYAEDGWSNVARTHVNTSVLSVQGKPYLLRTHDMTGRPKTGDELYEIVKTDLQYALEKYGVDVIAICTDNGPDGKKMRRLIKENMNWIAVFECWAHQMHLITGNALAVKEPWLEDIKKAIELIKFFVHHYFALDCLRAEQLRTRIVALMLILPVLTRWLSQYCCLRRLILLENAIQITVLAHRDALRNCIGRKQEQIAVAESAITTALSPQFWTNIKRAAKHLEPLAIASTNLQAPYCRLDMVALTLGNLYCYFSSLPDHEAAMKDTVVASLERRWKATDQELMLLAVYLNPLVRDKYFNAEVLPPVSFFQIIRRAVKRLLRYDPAGDVEFTQACADWQDNTGFFSDESIMLQDYVDAAKARNDPLPLVTIFRRLTGSAPPTSGRPMFIALAIRIHSILPNSAGPERVFSDFGMIHSKRRNRLNPQKVHKTSLVRADRLQIHANEGRIPQRKPRHCSLDDIVPQQMEEGNDSDGEASEETAEGGSGGLTAAEMGDVATVENEFEQLSAALIGMATAERERGGEDEEEEDEDSSATSHPAPTQYNARSRVPARFKKLLLEEVFVYPADVQERNLVFYWDVGSALLDAEINEMDTDQTAAAAARPRAAAGSGGSQDVFGGLPGDTLGLNFAH